ncbi:MAG: undecaprenyl-phosphate glucose phosphotransferase [Ignavibacteria bacterium]|nr:undecaprenyl-phosphate glucose phosphotransferase [Ignavibacteria bacterium]MDH7527403.1 undecaprenyl-phosphate glucose phosphotransferase [Ignavibacteria bacterium]
MSKKTEKILLLVTDFITINLAYIVYFYFRVETGWFQLISRPEFLLPMLVIYFYWFLIFLFVGMYRTWFAASRFDELTLLFKTSFVGVMILFFLIFIDDLSAPSGSTQRYLIFIYWGIFLLFVGSGRIFVRSLQRNLLLRGIGRRNTIIIGYNEKAKEVFNDVNRAKALGLDVIGFVLVNENSEIKDGNGKILGRINEIEKIVNEYNVKEVIIALDKHEHELMLDVIAKCDFNDLTIKIVPDLYEIISGQARTNQLYGIPLIEVNPQLMPVWERKIKRLMDIVFSLIILIVTLPITLLVAIAIKLDSEGPVFYKQIRVGKDGKEFKIYKFRSMFKDAEKHTGPVWSTKDDPRITRVGKILRKFRLDEIPQFINVLRGEMSLVGPRPERPYFVEKLSKEIPLYKRRLKVKPGITGWAQVKHKYDESIEDVKKKLQYDLYYIENISLRMDLKILFRTIFVVLFGKGHFQD